MSINVVFAGNVGRDIDLRQAGETSVLEFDVAVEGWDSRAKQKSTTWIHVSLFGKRGEQLRDHVQTGGKVLVRGVLSINTYQKREGGQGISVECKADDVELHGGGRSGETERAQERPQQQAPARRSGGWS